MQARIKTKLSVLNPTICEVIDESEQHRGHAGYGKGHYALTIQSEALKGPLLAQHRKIYQLLAEEMKSIHALRINIV